MNTDLPLPVNFTVASETTISKKKVVRLDRDVGVSAMELRLENKQGKRERKKEGDSLQVDTTIAVHKQPCNIITYADAI